MIGGKLSLGTEPTDPGESADRELLEAQLRSEIKHALASPVRGIAILADLLEEALGSNGLDPDALRDISMQLSKLSNEATDRLVQFGSLPGANRDG